MRKTGRFSNARFKRGFTLVETMVAICLFSILMVGGLRTVFGSWGVVRKSRERLYVAKILESRIEEIRNLTFEELQGVASQFQFAIQPATDAFGVPINPDICDDAFRQDLVDATGIIYIDDIDTNWKKVTVRVTWKANAGNNMLSESLTSYIVKQGVGRR